MTLLYNLLFIMFAVFYLPFFCARLKQAQNPWKLVKDRTGFLSNLLVNAVRNKSVIWVHAVSVGEVMSAKVFVRKLQEKFPGYACVLSTVTPTGQKMAFKVCTNKESVFYFPFDLSFIVKRVISLIKPKIVLLVETEIWPNFITACARKGVSVGIVNGRLSPRSFKRYNRIRFLVRPILDKISFISVRTDNDGERFVALGFKPESISVTGNMKFDSAFADEISGLTSNAVKKEHGFPADGTVLLAGSTHPGEEEIVLSVFSRLRSGFPNLKLILAPRHVDRARALGRTVEAAGFKMRFSQPLDGEAPDREFDVFILNTMGKLKELYAIADVVFMGGSLVAHGGQNPIEPASFKRPIIFGPNVFNFSEIYERLEAERAAHRVTDADSFYKQAVFYLSSTEGAAAMGERAFEVICKLQGATDRNIDLIQSFLEAPEKAAVIRKEAFLCR